nr:MAG TPA: hypothetical protein [Caudoviricetes sp.]
MISILLHYKYVRTIKLIRCVHDYRYVYDLRDCL